MGPLTQGGKQISTENVGGAAALALKLQSPGRLNRRRSRHGQARLDFYACCDGNRSYQAKQGVADWGDSIATGNYRRQFHGLIEFLNN
jgi:hypothetical protein